MKHSPLAWSAALCLPLALIGLALAANAGVAAISSTLASLAAWARPVGVDVAAAAHSLAETSAHVDALTAQLADKGTGVTAQLAGLRSDTNAQLTATRKMVDQRTGEAMTEIHGANLTLLAAVGDANAQLAAANVAISQTTGALTNAANIYAAVPGDVRTALGPSWLAVEPEITCRTLAGDGYGGCWHSRVTALMGEASRVGGVITQQAPRLVDDFAGIQSDVRRFTDRAVAPCKFFWCGVKGVVLTGGVGVRAAGAAGLFEVRKAERK